MFSPLLLKVLLAPSFIGLISLAGGRWGPTTAGYLAGLPVIAGPILFLLWVEQGAEFARSASLYSLAGVGPVIAFAVVYAWSSRSYPLLWSTALAYSMWLLFAITVVMLPLGIVGATVLAATSLLVAPHLFPSEAARCVIALPPLLDVKVRMLAGLVLTLLVTGIAGIAGTRVSGILCMFPVLSSILTISIHRSGGRPAAIAVLEGLASGLWSLVAFCATLIIIPGAHTGYSFVVATAVAIAVQSLVPRSTQLQPRT